MPTEEVLLRLAEPADLAAVAEVFLAARAAAVPAMPPLVQTPDEVRAMYDGFGLGTSSRMLWVADSDGEVIGFAELKLGWLDDLYVHPDHAGTGIGSALLEVVKAQATDGFSLWVFESNHPARRFYARHGLVELETTDGTMNHERSPDIRMVWPGTDPVPFLRTRMDEVDAELAEVLARRFALTGAIQAHKEVPGAAGRDPDREAEIVARMAAHAPSLAPERLAVLMRTVIEQALASYDEDGRGRGLSEGPETLI